MPEYDRRMNDAKLDQIEAEIRELCSNSIAEHASTGHHPISNEEVDRILAERVENRKIVGRMIDMLEGKPVTDLAGRVVGHERGLRETADESYSMLQKIEDRTNGGVTITQRIKPDWTRNQKIAAWSVGTTFTVGAVAQVVTLIALMVHTT